MIDEDRTGEAPLVDERAEPERTVALPGGESLVPPAYTAALEEQTNEEGLLEGYLSSDVAPHVFVNGGRTGRSAAHWAGGSGAQGNQAVGAVTLVAPRIVTRPATRTSLAQAWVQPGTGRATVTRSYTGTLIGRNSASWYITRAAALRFDRHERLHIASSRSIHNTHIVPLERRIARHRTRRRALSGPTVAAVRTVLQNLINWNNTIRRFRTADTAANTPGGTVDTVDTARADYPIDYGPQRVGRVRYAHYADVPPGPAARRRRGGGGP
jgi:hypothetical protein